MSNKKLSFVEAVKSGKDFRCVETGQYFQMVNGKIHIYNHAGDPMIFSKLWLTKEFEIIEVKKELTESEIKEAVYYSLQQAGVLAECDLITKFMLRKLGFK